MISRGLLSFVCLGSFNTRVPRTGPLLFLITASCKHCCSRSLPCRRSRLAGGIGSARPAPAACVGFHYQPAGAGIEWEKLAASPFACDGRGTVCRRALKGSPTPGEHMAGARGSEREPASFTAACSSSGGCAAGAQSSRAGKQSGKGRWLLPPKVPLGLAVVWWWVWERAVGCSHGRARRAPLLRAAWDGRGGKPLLSLLFSIYTTAQRKAGVRLMNDICIF